MSSKYNYDGIPLDIYCKMHGLNVETQRNRVRNYVKDHPGVSLDEATKLTLDKCGTRFCKYVYQGMSVAHYCSNNGLEYTKIFSRIEKIKEDNNNISDEEASRMAIEEVSNRGIKYFYDGIPLVDYCEQHPEYSYNSISTYIKRKRKRNPKANVQDIINSYFATKHTPHNYHFVQGIPLLEYCDLNGIVYGSIMSRLSQMRKDAKYSNLSEEERLNTALKEYKRHYLFYNGISLYTYCMENDYSYNSVYNYAMNMIKEKPEITINEAIEEALKNIKRFGIKYYYSGEPLIDYCDKHGLDKKAVRRRIATKISDGLSLDEATEETIQFFRRKKHIKNLNKIFNYLKAEDNIPQDILIQIIDYLNIDYDNLLFMLKFCKNILQAINIIWYFHDNEDGNKLSISLDRYKEILDQIKQLQNINLDDVVKLEIAFIVGVFKADLFDSRYLLLIHQENFHYSTIRSVANSYGLDVNRDFCSELNDEVNVLLLELIDKINNNSSAGLVSYFTKHAQGYIINYILDYKKKNSSVVSLSNPIYSNNNSKSNKTLQDKIIVKSDEEDDFGDEMMDILNGLDDLEKRVIVYKFQMGLDSDEIAKMLGISDDEFGEFERKLLEKLKNNDGIKALYRRRFL